MVRCLILLDFCIEFELFAFNEIGMELTLQFTESHTPNYKGRGCESAGLASQFPLLYTFWSM